MTRTSQERLEMASVHLDVLARHLKRTGFDDDIVLDAVCQRLGAAIEELSGLGPNALRSAFGEAWPRIQATRNAIAHNYGFINTGVIRATIERDVPAFTDSVNRMRQSL